MFPFTLYSEKQQELEGRKQVHGCRVWEVATVCRGTAWGTAWGDRVIRHGKMLVDTQFYSFV